MYSLLVSANAEEWQGEPAVYELSRCFEFTDPVHDFERGHLSDEVITKLSAFPCVFAFEDQCEMDARVGNIKTSTRKRSESQSRVHN